MSLMKTADYRWWLLGTTSEQLASTIRQLVIPFLVFSLTASTQATGVLISVVTAVVLVSGIFGGVIVDRVDRRIAMYARALIGGAVWAITAFLVASNLLSFSLLLGLAIVAAVSQGLFGIADNAALRSIITDDKEFSSAQAVNEGRAAVISLAGGPIGGLLYGVAHWSPFVASAALLALLALSAFFIKANLHPRPVAPNDQSNNDAMVRVQRKRGNAVVKTVVDDIREGVVYVFSSGTKRTIGLGAMVVNFAFGLLFNAVILLLMKQGYTAFDLSLLDAAMAAAMIPGAIASAKLIKQFPTGKLLVIGATLIGAVAAGVAIWHSYAILYLWFALMGLILPNLNAATNSYFFATTPSHLQGRAGSAISVLAMGLGAVAPAIAGRLVSVDMSAIAMAIAGVLGFALAVTFTLSPSVRNIGLPDGWADYEASLNAVKSLPE